MSRKDERLHLRVTKEDKEFLQWLAERYTNGNINALFDKLINELKQEHGGDR